MGINIEGTERATARELRMIVRRPGLSRNGSGVLDSGKVSFSLTSALLGFWPCAGPSVYFDQA